MLHNTKLLMRRLAYMPWLLAAGLVLGWSGEAVADPLDPNGNEEDHSALEDHKHATDPYLRVTHELDEDGTDDKIIVSWSKSYSKNFDTNTGERGNGTEAERYLVTLYTGEVPTDPSVAENDDREDMTDSNNSTANQFTFEKAVVDDNNSATFTLNLEAGFYWVRMEVQVPDGDETSDVVMPSDYFTKQIAVEPDYTLLLNASNVREDAGVTNITVIVKVSDDETVAQDTSVPLRLGTNQTGLNSRFRIEFPTLTIPKGKKEVEGTIRFTPIDDDDDEADEDLPDDDLVVTIRTVGALTADASTDIRLVDTDKASTVVNLSVSHASISKRSDRTEVVVTATLNGRKVRQSLNIFLQEDQAFSGDMADRGRDYEMVIDNPLVIPRSRVSGTTRINITPLGRESGIIRLKVDERYFPQDENGRTIRVEGVSIDLTDDVPIVAETGLTATPFSMREDDGSKEVKLRIALQNAVSADEVVRLSVYDDDDDELDLAAMGDNFADAVPALRDVDFDVLNLDSFTIPKGEKEGTITITVVLKDNDEDDDFPRAFAIGAEVGGNEHLAGILITDDESTSDSITLAASPNEIREGAGPTQVTVTGTLHGKEFEDDVDVFLTIDPSVTGAATRDLDYETVVPKLVIPGGSTQGTMTFTITPNEDNDGEEDNETIRLTGLESHPPEAEDEFGDLQELTVGYVDITLIDADAEDADGEDDGAEAAPADPTKPAFADDAISDQEYTVGTAIDDLVLPEPTGGDAPMTYSVSTLPAGLEFDTATRTLSGTPTEETDGAVNIIYTVIDNDSDVAATIFTITVNEGELPLPAADGQLTATPSAVREDAGTTQVSLTVTLAAAKATAETVTFTIVAPSEGTLAVRDVDYTASLGAVVTIPAGSTVGTTTLVLTPVNNTTVDSPKAIGVQATFASGARLKTDIKIADDETPSTSISLSVSQNAISEDSAETTITVTATLNGGVLTEDKNVVLAIDASSTAQRDVDYAARFNAVIAIPADSITGSTQFAIDPVSDTEAEGSETIKLTGTVTGLTEDEVVITISDEAATTDDSDDSDEPDDSSLAFADDTVIENQTYTAGTAIDALVLPEATGGEAPITYSVSTLPAGLSFDTATRTLSGTPTAATDGAVTIIYTVIDSTRDASALIFTITVNEGAELPPPAADGQLTATPSAVREDAGTTQVSLRVTLAAARATAETVTFTIVAPSEGTPAVRDVDYAASLGAVVSIPAGSTVGTTTLALTPINNTTMDSPRAIGVQATFASGATLKTDIRIADDETPSTSISLSVSQNAITEDSGETTITVTATLNGGALIENKNVILSIDASSTAMRDVDYAALFNAIIAIPAGSLTGSTQFAIRPVSDTEAEGSETIKLTGTVTGLTGDEVVITISDEAAMTDGSDDMDEPDDSDDSSLAFSNTVANQEYTSETPITALVLPEASGGTAPFTYSLSALPAGLSFDASTRTISGTPSAATDGAVLVIYTVIDSDRTAAALTFTITVYEELSFGDFFDFFGSGKIVPTASHDLAEIREFIVGQRVEDLVLPEASGGTAPLTYRLSPALPVGLTFDAATRTIAGTPRTAAETVYTYTVTDANGASASLALQTLPEAFSLADNFPNPFNPATTIKYALPQAADVELTVYNVVGQPVRTLVAEHQSAGRYVVEWDATNDSGHSLASGMYFYRLQAGEEFLEIKKMLLLK